MRERFNNVLRARLHDENEERDEEGFTLIELLIVIVVLGILAAVTVFGLSGTASQSAVSACKSDARTVELAADAYHANSSTGAWPATGDATLADLVNPTSTVVNGQPAGVAPYLRAAPSSSHYTITLAAGPSGQVYVQVQPLTPSGVAAGNFDTNVYTSAGAPGGTLNICEAVK
jgi:prepilin-type N-terminal cleavage/methylation domain-containing protein